MNKSIFLILVLVMIICPMNVVNSNELENKIMFKVMQSKNPQLVEAANLLKNAGILNETVKKNRRDLVKPDCVIVLNQRVLQSSLAKDLINNQLPEEVKEINIAFINGGIKLNGRIDGPLFINPKFESSVNIQTIKPNTIDVTMNDVSVAGINVKFLSGMIFKFLSKKLAEPFKDFISMELLKKNKVKIIRITVKPESFSPMLGRNGHVSRLFFKDGQMFLNIDLH